MRNTSNIHDRAEAAIAERKRQHQDHVALVRRLERRAIDNPKSYRRRVWGMAMIGYGYIFGLLGIAVLAALWTVSVLVDGHVSAGLIKLLFILGLVMLMIVRSLWVKVDPPEGVVLSQAEAPELYQQVNAIADELDAAEPHLKA